MLWDDERLDRDAGGALVGLLAVLGLIIGGRSLVHWLRRRGRWDRGSRILAWWTGAVWVAAVVITIAALHSAHPGVILATATAVLGWGAWAMVALLIIRRIAVSRSRMRQ